MGWDKSECRSDIDIYTSISRGYLTPTLILLCLDIELYGNGLYNFDKDLEAHLTIIISQ